MTFITRTFRLGLMAEEEDMPFVLDTLPKLEDELNAAAEGWELPTLYAVIDLRINKDKHTYDWDETQIEWYVPIAREEASPGRFRRAVVRQLLERLNGLEEVPAELVDKIRRNLL
ncbi:MAG: hypothetical protein GVY26_00230 [Bacteroidetes bacterium]|nr:hypothetical protein [Bacteroidota bacterium]